MADIGAFQLTTERNGRLHLVSDLPAYVSVSKVLWDAIATGSASRYASVNAAGEAGELTDLVVTTAECTFTYRREAYREDSDTYICHLMGYAVTPVGVDGDQQESRGVLKVVGETNG